MLESSITRGNASIDGPEFAGWLTGDLESWSRQRDQTFDATRLGLRRSRVVEVKWGVHPRGQQRPAGWADPSPKTAISILVSGDFRITFRLPGDPFRQQETRLSTPGDYVLWREDVEHTWFAEQDSIIVTVRWME